MFEHEIYVLLERIDRNAIAFFRENYLTGFNSSSDVFEYPAYRGETTFETEDFEEMLNFMLEGDKGYFRFYLSPSGQNTIHHGMVFFNRDNTLVLGIAVDEVESDFYAERLSTDFNSDLILITAEMAPPDNAEEFKELIRPGFWDKIKAKFFRLFRRGKATG